MRGKYRFAGPRAEWIKMDKWPSGSQLESFGVDAAWLDMTFPHHGGTWRVEGLHKSYRCRRPVRLTIVSGGHVATIATTALRKIIENNPPNPH